jgi:hypothetical protein
MEGDRTGLLIMGREYSYLAVMRTAGGLQLVRPKNRIGDLKTKSVFLRVSMSDGICEFSYSMDGKNFSPAGETFAAKPGVWIGAKVGLFSVGQGYADYDWFRFAPLAQSAQTPARAR